MSLNDELVTFIAAYMSKPPEPPVDNYNAVDKDELHRSRLADVHERIIALIRTELIVLPHEKEALRACEREGYLGDFTSEVGDALYGIIEEKIKQS